MFVIIVRKNFPKIGWCQGMDNQSRSGEHERAVQELRRSNAAGTHGDHKYNRKTKYPIRSVQDYLEAWYGEDGVFDIDEIMYQEEREGL